MRSDCPDLGNDLSGERLRLVTLPYYTEADLIFDMRLLGTWSNDNDDAQTFILAKGTNSEEEKGSAVSR